MLYTAKCFWPGVSERDVARAAAVTSPATAGAREAVFRGALYLPSDELVLALFDSASRVAVKRASELAGMPCERVIESRWVAAPDVTAGDSGTAGPSTTNRRDQA